MDKANAKNNNKPNVRLPPALDPERVAITQPYREFVATGLISKFNLEITAVATTMTCELSEKVPVPDGVSRKGIAPAMAKKLIVDAKLWTPQGKKSGADKKTPELPKRTLVKKDLEANDTELKKRVDAVAREIGSTTAKGRIGSLRMMRKDLNTFDKWWKSASAPAKVRLLMDGKHLDQLTPEEVGRVAGLPCPFLGSDAVPTPTEEEEQETTSKAEGSGAAAKRRST